MMTAFSQYNIGDWVVHQMYGVGQIKSVEKKPIHGEAVKCFRVETKDGAFWFPKIQAENPRIRPVVTPATLQLALGELEKTSQNLDPDRHIWKKKIDEAKTSDDLILVGQMIRDLTILKTLRKANQTEEKALHHFLERFINEWAAALKKDAEKIRRQLDQQLLAIKNAPVLIDQANCKRKEISCHNEKVEL